MCVPIHSEKAARAWTEEKLDQLATLPERYPMNEGLQRYIDSERRNLRDDITYWQRYHRWMMDWDAKTLALKAPEVRTDTGVKAVVRALTPKQLKAVQADEPFRTEDLTIGKVNVWAAVASPIRFKNA